VLEAAEGVGRKMAARGALHSRNELQHSPNTSEEDSQLPLSHSHDESGFDFYVVIHFIHKYYYSDVIFLKCNCLLAFSSLHCC